MTAIKSPTVLSALTAVATVGVLFFLLSFAHAKPPVATLKLPVEWKAKEVLGVSAAWENTKNSNQVITVFEGASAKPMDFLGETEQSIATGISTLRQITLEQLGFTDWRLESVHYRKTKDVAFVEMNGRYRRPDGTQVKFFERQFFKQRQYIQISYTIDGEHDAEFKQISRDEAHALMKRLDPYKDDL